jgi:hypothetical protein
VVTLAGSVISALLHARQRESLQSFVEFPSREKTWHAFTLLETSAQTQLCMEN